MGSLYLNDLEAASWGVSWEPDARRDETWPGHVDEHPPDEECGAAPEASDVRSMLMRFDAYGEDVRRLRRLFVGN